MAEVDAELATALKAAKSKKMFFAFVPKGSDGKLIVSKKKIPPKQIAEARKEIGGGNPVTGKCFGPISAMVFMTAKEAPATMGAALKKVAKRDSGLAVIPDFKVAGDADAEEEEKEEGTGADAGAGAQAPSKGAGADAAAAASADAAGASGKEAPPAAGGQGNVAGIQKLLQKLGFDPGKIDGVMGPHTKEAIKKFQQANGLAADGIAGPKTQAAMAKALKGGAGAAGGAPAAGASAGGAPGAQAPAGGAQPAARKPAGQPTLDGASKDAATMDYGPWQAARQAAITDLKALATKVAATKHASAGGVLKEIQSIIARLPANPGKNDLDKLEDFVRNDDTITAAEEVPGHFHNLDIRGPLLKALESLKT